MYMLKMSSKWVNVAVSYKRLKMMITAVFHDFRPVTIYSKWVGSYILRCLSLVFASAKLLMLYTNFLNIL